MAEDKEEAPDSPDVYFEPLVNLPPVETLTMEEDEDQLVKLRAKLFRYDSEENPAEWKERGVGDVKILKNRETSMCRVVMRRDKTHKICANHYVIPHMELVPNCGSDRAWVWRTAADFADEEPKNELLAIRFANADNAQKFKEKFAEAKTIMKETLSKQSKEKSNGTDSKEDKETDSVTERLGDMSVKESGDIKTEKQAEDSKTETTKQGTDPPDDESATSTDKDQAER